MALTRGLRGVGLIFMADFYDRQNLSPMESADNDRAASEECMFLKCKESICVNYILSDR